MLERKKKKLLKGQCRSLGDGEQGPSEGTFWSSRSCWTKVREARMLPAFTWVTMRADNCWSFDCTTS